MNTLLPEIIIRLLPAGSILSAIPINNAFKTVHQSAKDKKELD